ncbi:MAG TPA: formate dehydrogenase accessory protein FdhE [Bryobacteraceae bacterium]
MKWGLDRRIARATELAEVYPAAREILTFYRELALLQKSVSEDLHAKSETDVRVLVRYFPALLDLACKSGVNLETPARQEEVLLACWEGDLANDPAGRFYAHVLLQPYAEYLASRGDIPGKAADPRCPFCNARPVVGVLRGEGDGAKRWLLCSLCGTEWQYRRVICPNCGEENKDKLPVYLADQIAHVRVDACDTCQTYLKSVDLTKDGHAVPVVDELATVALNIWAEERGYSKFEPNLLGM